MIGPSEELAVVYLFTEPDDSDGRIEVGGSSREGLSFCACR